MVTMAQSVVNWRNTHTHIYNYIARIHSHTYINTVTTTLYEALVCLFVSLLNV